MTDDSKSAVTFFTDFDFVEFAVIVFDDNSCVVVSREGAELQDWLISGGRVRTQGTGDTIRIGKTTTLPGGLRDQSEAPLVEVALRSLERPLQFEARTLASEDTQDTFAWALLPDWAYILMLDIVGASDPSLLDDQLYFIAAQLEDWLQGHSNAVTAMREFSISQLRNRGKDDPRNAASLERINHSNRVILERPLLEFMASVHVMNSPHRRLQAYRLLRDRLQM